MAARKAQMSDMPVQMSERIFENMSLKEMLPMRATSKHNKAVIDGIITRRHTAMFGATDKPIASKIRDLILMPVLHKIQYEPRIYHEGDPDYGYELLLGNRTMAEIRPDLPNLDTYKVERPIHGNFDYMQQIGHDQTLIIKNMLLQDKDAILHKYPQYKELILTNFYTFLSRLPPAVVGDLRNTPEYVQYTSNPPDVRAMQREATEHIARTVYEYNGLPRGDYYNYFRVRRGIAMDFTAYFTLPKFVKHLKGHIDLEPDEKQILLDFTKHKVMKLF